MIIDFLTDNTAEEYARIISERFEQDSRRFNRALNEEQEAKTI